MSLELSPHEWNFEAVPDAELMACCYWEYARESAFIRDLRRRCADPVFHPKTMDDFNRDLFIKARLGVEKNFQRVCACGAYPTMIARGFWERPDMQCFPRPWLALLPGERRNKILPPGTKPEAFARIHPSWTDVIWSEAERYVREGTRLEGWVMPPPFIHEGAEIGVFRIRWKEYSNDALAEAFRLWLKANRPETQPSPPSGRGHKPGDWRANLTRLAVMRLLSRFTALGLVAGNKLPAVWETKQFAGQKWADPTKWYDARREAGRLFRGLFPFLPPAEKPLSWLRQRQSKTAA